MGKPLTAWSYSRFALYELCPLKFKFEVIDKIREPESPAMKRGSTIHKGIAAYVMGQSEDCPPEALQHPFPWKLIQATREFEDKVVEQQWGYTRQWQPTGWFGSDTWFRATLDAAVLYEDMAADVLDWKSGRPYDSAYDQMELNAIALFSHFKPARSVTTRMVYLDHGSEKTAEYERSDLPKLISKWEGKVAPMFADTQFIARPNHRCGSCYFSRSNTGKCRFG